MRRGMVLVIFGSLLTWFFFFFRRHPEKRLFDRILDLMVCKIKRSMHRSFNMGRILPRYLLRKVLQKLS